MADGLSFRVRYRGPMPPSVRRELRGWVRRYARLVPRWCELLCVDWGRPTTADAPDEFYDEGDEAAARCYPLPHYRRATVVIYPVWLELDEAERREAFRHELRHMVTAPLVFAFTDALRAIAGADDAEPARLRLRPFVRHATEQLRQAWEGVTQDLTIEGDDEECPKPATTKRRPRKAAARKSPAKTS